jgi:hypothetical protein
MVLRERQWPSWRPVVLSMVAPAMLAIAYGAAVSAIVGVMIGTIGILLILAVIVLTSPLVSVDSQALTVGRAELPRQSIASVAVIPAEDVEEILRTDGRYFTAIRGSAPQVLHIVVSDAEDPHVGWLVRLHDANAFALDLTPK